MFSAICAACPLLQAVAGAALAVSSLMNAPPGFLEFLLCIPWRQLPLLYPGAHKAPGQQEQQEQDEQQEQGQQQEQQSPEQVLAQVLAVDYGERRLLVNMRIHPQLMRPVLDFMYKPEHADSVPPLLRPQQQLEQQAAAVAADNVRSVGGGANAGSSSCTADAKLLDTVAALLDGATPLHCAALRGNPAQVDHLLYCGADPSMRTAAGELALELVPLCGSISKESRRRQCHCLGPVEQEVRLLAAGRAAVLPCRVCCCLGSNAMRVAHDRLCISEHIVPFEVLLDAQHVMHDVCPFARTPPAAALQAG